MEPALDTIFKRPSSNRDRSILFDTLTWVEAQLAEGACAVADLPAWLRQHQADCPTLGQYGHQEGSIYLQAMMTLLADDASVVSLTDQLAEHSGRYIAATLLGWFGDRASAAVSALVDLASGTSGAVEAAKVAAIRIGHAEPEIMKWLQIFVANNDDVAFRELANLMMRVTPQASSTFLDLLIQAAQSTSPDMREVVADTINELSSTNYPMLEPIRQQLLADPVARVREAMANT